MDRFRKGQKHTVCEVGGGEATLFLLGSLIIGA